MSGLLEQSFQLLHPRSLINLHTAHWNRGADSGGLTEAGAADDGYYAVAFGDGAFGLELVDGDQGYGGGNFSIDSIGCP